ncbi:MAG TPA: DUF6066 family protein [Anaeromyxobacteraceae bacterium]|nr:DUF6066 family protein [Anaeromyxobacteraceae bacterium]
MTTPLRFAALALAATLAGAVARADGRFDALERRAERLESLEAFLARYVGRCGEGMERRTCESNVAAARRAVTGRTFAVRVPDAATLVRAQVRGEGYLVLVTPFVDGGGLALTHGEPTHQDPRGQPVIGLIPIHGTLPPGMLDLDFEGPFRTGAIEMEIVFRPERTWKLKRRGEPGWYEGVAARFLGLRIVNARTGDEIAARVL